MLYSNLFAHTNTSPVSIQVSEWLEALGDKLRDQTQFLFSDPERFDFGWIPGDREGIRLDDINDEKISALREIFHSVLSERGVVMVDAIIATEAALGVLSNARDYRDPHKYWTAIFGEPGSKLWGLRFEGHHLSINLTFKQDQLISATPLFLGVNPETIPSGPDAGLRALAAEVDGRSQLFESLDKKQQQVARGADEWFQGFLTSAGERRANPGKPGGIAATRLSDAQQQLLGQLIAAHVETIASSFSKDYLLQVIQEDWEQLHFYWSGAEKPGSTYYYRIAGSRLLLEHENKSGGSHVHAVWRDVASDVGTRD